MGREKYDLIHVMDPADREPIPLWIKRYKRTGKLVRDSNGTVHFKKPLKLGKHELAKNVQRLPHVWGGWVQAALTMLPLIPSAINGVKDIWHSIFGGKINPNDLPREIIDRPTSGSVNTIGRGIFSSILSQFGLGLPKGGRIFLGQGVPMTAGRLSYLGSGLQPGKQLLTYPIVQGGAAQEVMSEYKEAVDSIPGGRIYNGNTDGGWLAKTIGADGWCGAGEYNEYKKTHPGASVDEWRASKFDKIFGRGASVEPGKYATIRAPPINNEAVSPLI